MDLSPEDALRLNVLLVNDIQAVRIDESTMTVYGLTASGQEARVKLNPNQRDDPYLRGVRELLSGHVLGSPRGYPVFLQRWTRMGQTRDMRLEQLLLLGEPEAVVAVVNAPGLTSELARRAWWAMPVVDNARRMLERDCVAEGVMGTVLAEYLADHLPFEEEPALMVESVRLMLRPGLLSAERRLRLWQAGRRRAAYLLGFLQALPDNLPEPLREREDWAALEPRIQSLVVSGNPYGICLAKVLTGPGQTWLKVAEEILRRAPNQDVVNSWLDTVANYFSLLRPQLPEEELVTLLAESERLWSTPETVEVVAGLTELRATVPELAEEVRAMLCLARLSYAVVRPIFSRTTAIGTLMQRKLEPVTRLLMEQLAVLRRGQRN